VKANLVVLAKVLREAIRTILSRLRQLNFCYLSRTYIWSLMIKYTVPFLTKLEDMIAESDYTLRYEKGNFKSGYCVLKDQKIIIVNKFYTTEGKVNALMEILKNVALDRTRFTEKSQKLYEEIIQFQTA
jgi:hypothetical protein